MNSFLGGDFSDETEEAHIEREGGDKTGPYNAIFAGESIIIDPKSDVEKGDIVIRMLPSGREERNLAAKAEYINDGNDSHYLVTTG